jgi:hypothetical protein
VKDFYMLHDLVLTTRYVALAGAAITHTSLDHSAAAIFGKSSSPNFLLIAGAIGLLVILGGIVGGIVFVRHKQASSQHEYQGQPASTMFNARQGYGQDYSTGMIAAEQEPWPWARKPSPPTGYNPITPVPEMMRTWNDRMTPVPEVPAVPSVPMQYPLQRPLQQPPVPELQRVQQPPVQQSAVPQPPALVPDPALEAIMRQVQVGLFAMPAQYKGQKDREAEL